MIYKPSQSEQAHIFLDKCFERKRWVKIEYIPETRSINQLRYIWLVFTIIANDTGNNSQDIYDYYLEKFPTYKDVILHGEEVRIKISMSGMSKEQMSRFIDQVVIDGRQEGFIIPDPSENEALEAYNYYRQKGLI
jgi:hypothetical protein